MAYFVTQRTHEIGIRMALGALPRDVLGMVLAQGVRLAVAGVMSGVVGALLVTRAIAHAALRRQPARSGDAGGASAALTAVALSRATSRRAARRGSIRSAR